MIKELTPLSFAEVQEYLKNSESNKEFLSHLKKFSKINVEDAKKLKEELTNLNIVKLNKEHLVKIIDFLPEDKDAVISIVSDAGLDDNEINLILDIVKKYVK
ncbi:MAG: hypothetical protein QXO70_05235 [Candidatus Pacearchaeota archaeon]